MTEETTFGRIEQSERIGRLDSRTAVGYGIGEMALNFMVAGISNYLLFFYTDVFGITAAAAGLLMLIARMWDAFNDPVMGLVVDRTRSRWGNYRPYILFASGPACVLTVLVFTTPPFESEGKLIWAYATLILWGMAFTAVAVPYNALLAMLASDSFERSSLSAVKTIFAVLGSLLVVVLAKPMTETIGETLQEGYSLTFTLFAVFAFFILLACFWLTNEGGGGSPLGSGRLFSRRQFRTITHNRPFLLLVTFFLFFQIAFSVFRTVELYYFNHVLIRDSYFSGTMLAAHLFAVAGMAVMPICVKWMDKKKAVLAGSIIGCLVLFILYLVSHSLPLAVGSICLSYFFLAIPYALFFGMVPDTVEYGQWKSGIWAAGLIFSLFTFTQKLSMGVAAAIVSWSLDRVGYAAGQLQTESAIEGIRLMRTLLPMSVILLGLLVFVFYDLNRATQLKIRKELTGECE